MNLKNLKILLFLQSCYEKNLIFLPSCTEEEEIKEITKIYRLEIIGILFHRQMLSIQVKLVYGDQAQERIKRYTTNTI